VTAEREVDRAVGDEKPVRYEPRDADVRAIAIFGVGLAVLILLTFAVVAGVFHHLGAIETRQQPPPPPLGPEPDRRPPEPRLQVHPIQEYQEFRAEQQRILGSYGWVDREAGVVKIPIGRAMELLAERGLSPLPSPSPAAPSPPPAPAAGAALLLAAAPPAARAASRQEQVLREIGFDQRLGEAVPLDLAFRDSEGRAVRLGDYFGRRPVVLALVYYECPMLCTLTLNGLASTLGVVPFEVGRDFEVLTVSFNPEETPAQAAVRKKASIERYGRPGAAAGWHFLTGEAGPIARLTAAVGFRYVWDAETRQYAHAAGLVVLTPEGKVARYLYGVEYAPKDLRLALVEASENRIGSPVDQLLLYCYHYDPATGKYGAVVMRLVRLGGALTVLALASFMIFMWRRDHRAPPGAASATRQAP
jgi:protein SCO1